MEMPDVTITKTGTWISPVTTLRKDTRRPIPTWGHDVGSTPAATFAYENLEAMIDFGHRAVHLTVNVSKAGDEQAAREKVRLFTFPGMGHCGDGPGPNTWNRLAPRRLDQEENRAR